MILKIISYFVPNVKYYFLLDVTDIVAEEVNGESINDAVFKRMTTVEDKYNVNLEVVDYPNQNECVTAFSRSVAAGDDMYQTASSAPTTTVRCFPAAC